MFTGTSQAKTVYTPFTGLAAFSINAVNPSKATIEELIGRQWPIDVNYDLRQDLNQQQVRPIEFWVYCKETNIHERITFQIGKDDVVSQSGNLQFINAKGVSRYAKTIEEANQKYPKLAPFVRPLKVGEDALYTFMQRAMGYKPSADDAKFLTDCEMGGITPETLYNNDLQGLKNFIDYVNSKSRRIGLVFGVKQKDKVLDNGAKVTQDRQVILNNPDFFFTLAASSITDYNLGKLQEVIDEKKNNNVSLGTALFTVALQPFNKAECVNVIPDNPTASTNISWG